MKTRVLRILVTLVFATAIARTIPAEEIPFRPQLAANQRFQDYHQSRKDRRSEALRIRRRMNAGRNARYS